MGNQFAFVLLLNNVETAILAMILVFSVSHKLLVLVVCVNRKELKGRVVS